MKRRIFGLENEYGLTCMLNGQCRLSPDNIARYLFERVIPSARNANVFLENGARLYLDTGFHPEYATPECDDVAELVSHDKAGERLVEDLRHQAETRLHEDGISGDILLFKNNTDSAGNSYGCHENYLVSRDVPFPRLAEALIPFFVTRQIFAGAGKVLPMLRGFHYCLSQRAQHICQEISSSTTSARSIINTRDEPHADAERYRRLHIIVGDSNMSEVTTYLKFGTTRRCARRSRGRTAARSPRSRSSSSTSSARRCTSTRSTPTRRRRTSSPAGPTSSPSSSRTRCSSAVSSTGSSSASSSTTS